MKLSEQKYFQGILDCKLFHIILWDRDIDASKNMLNISLSVWEGKGKPLGFKREIAVENTVLFERTI
jgi:hypothetical protein